MSDQGFDARLAIDTALPFDGSSIPLEFLSEDLKKRGTIVDTNGMNGSRSHRRERTRVGNYTVSGTIELQPTITELPTLLEWILGGTESAGIFALDDALQTRQVMIDRVAKVFTYTDCYVNRATFRSSVGAPLTLVLDLIGKTETVGNAGTFPSLTNAAEAPWMFTDGVFTLVSSARTPMDFELVIDNALEAQFYNSLTATDIDPTDRIVTVTMRMPYKAANTALYAQALAGSSASFAFNDGTNTLTFSFGRLQFPDESPSVGGKSQIVLPLTGVARKNSSTDELTVTIA